MKNLILIIIILSFFNCKAQIVTGIHGSRDYGSDGYYYKDLNNDFNTFEGTWVYSNGNTSLTIEFQKKEMKQGQSGSREYFYDALVGEYHYIENGTEKINTLPNLDNDFSDIDDYNLVAIDIHKYGDLTCYNCESGNKLIKCSYDEPDCDNLSVPTMRFRYYTEDGVEKLNLYFYGGTVLGDIYGNDPECVTWAIPQGEYILVKQ